MRKIFIILLLPLFFAVSACAAPTLSATISPTQTSTATAQPTAAPNPTPDYANWPGVYFGVYAVDAKLKKSLGSKFAMQLYYHRWGLPFAGGPFVSNAENGWITMSTWEFNPTLHGPEDPYAVQPLKTVVDGKHDDYLRKFARDARDFNKPVLLRWGHEMNGDWYVWSGAMNGGATPDKYGDPQAPDGPELFVDAYRHIHDIFEEEGVENVAWVWCPNVVMQGELGQPWNDIANYYPGDEYVDWLCMDGYNWGASQNWSQWQTFDEVFAATYAQLQQIDPEKPIMIGEFASSDKGGDKAAWVADALQRVLSAYPQVRAIFWFNVKKETDWRMDSSPEVLDAFISGLSASNWSSTWPGYER